MSLLRSQVARSSVWSLLGQGAQLVFGFASFWFLSHWVGPSDYGMVGMASAVTGILGVVADAGVVAALVRLDRVTPEVEATGLWVSLAGAALLSSVAGASGPLLAWYFHDPRITWLAVALAAAFPVAAMGRVPTALLTREFRFRELTLVAFTSNVIAAFAAILLAYLGAGPWAIVAQTLLVFAVQSVALWVRRPYATSPRLATRSEARMLASFSWRMSGFALCAVLAQAGQTVLGGRMIGPEAPGLVGMAIRLVTNPVQRFVGALSSVFLPTVLRLEPSARAAAFTRAVRVGLLVTAPLSLVGAVLAPEVVTYLPPRWGGLVGTLRAVAIGVILEPMGWFSMTVLTAQGRAGGLLRFGIALVPLGWSGALAGALYGSAQALAWGGAATNVIGALALLMMVWRTLGLGLPFWRAVANPVSAAGVAAAVARLVVDAAGWHQTRAGLIAGVAAAAGAYAAVVIGFMLDDVRWVIAAVRSRGTGSAGSAGGSGPIIALAAEASGPPGASARSAANAGSPQKH